MSPERLPISAADLDEVVEMIDSLDYRLRLMESQFPIAGALATVSDGHVHQESMEILDDGISQGKGYQLDVRGIANFPTRSGRKFTLDLSTIANPVLAVDVKEDGVLVGSVPAAVTQIDVKEAGVLVGSALGVGVVTIPTGIICMWHGLLAAIPSGWALCDGTLGTPDLRSKFVKGTAAGVNPGATGGSATHTHTGHSAHSFTQPSAHVFTQPSDHATHDTHVTSAFTYASGLNPERGFDLVIQAAHNTHSAHAGGAVDAHSGGAVNAHSAHDTPNSEPAFYAIAYIMKT